MMSKNVDVQTKQEPLAKVIKAISCGDILYGDSKITDEGICRIIENILLRIPLPSGCFKTDGSTLLCFAGRNIVYALDKFCVRNELKLFGLEYFPDLNGLTYEELPNMYKRRIKETLWVIYCIDRREDKETQQNIVNRYREIIAEY